MTYLVVRTRRSDWALGGDFTMVACGTIDEAHHQYDYMMVQDGEAYARQSGTKYRLIELNGVQLQVLAEVDYASQD